MGDLWPNNWLRLTQIEKRRNKNLILDELIENQLGFWGGGSYFVQFANCTMKTIRAYLCGCLYRESRRNENHKAIWQRKDKTEDAFLSVYKTKGICSQIPLTSFVKSSERVREPVSLSWLCRVWPGTSSLISLCLIKKKKLEVPVLQRYSGGNERCDGGSWCHIVE